MNTLEELKYYCNEPNPIGALMLNGEWGCGKTYFIENDLQEALKETHIIIRISLFGITTIDAIAECVRKKWIDAYLRDKKWDEKGETISKWKDKLSKFPIPDEWKNIISFNPTDLLDISCKLNEKNVVIVFDDLERCKLNIMEVLGCINEYCENQKFHVIVIADEEKLRNRAQNNEKETCHVDDNNLTIILKQSNDEMEEMFSYDNIKEKLIERTIKYIPNFESIIENVIETAKGERQEYYQFLKENQLNILELFTSKYTEINYDDERPHNIRSLKCALQDFYRIYCVLKQNGFSKLDKWLISFTSYMLAYKAGKATEGDYGTIFTDDTVKQLYPTFGAKYMFDAEKHWILRGEWDTELLNTEITLFKEREKVVEAKDIVRTHCFFDVDDIVIKKGFSELLQMAYKGNLSLDEYVNFISNCYLSRIYEVGIEKVDWDKIRHGIENRIQEMLVEQNTDANVYLTLSETTRKNLLEGERNAYELILNLSNKNILMFNRNKQLYLETAKHEPYALFYKCGTKRFNVFDEEMAIVTADAFFQCNNVDKHYFGEDFEEMWQNYYNNREIDVEHTVRGFTLLSSLVEKRRDSLVEDGKTIAVVHTDSFLKHLKSLIDKKENN